MTTFSEWPMKLFMSKVLIHNTKKQQIYAGSRVLVVIILRQPHSAYLTTVIIAAILCGDLFSRFPFNCHYLLAHSRPSIQVT